MTHEEAVRLRQAAAEMARGVGSAQERGSPAGQTIATIAARLDAIVPVLAAIAEELAKLFPSDQDHWDEIREKASNMNAALAAQRKAGEYADADNPEMAARILRDEKRRQEGLAQAGHPIGSRHLSEAEQEAGVKRLDQ